MHPASLKRCQVWAMTGRPASSRKSLSMFAPMRVPFPAATIIADVMGARCDEFRTRSRAREREVGIRLPGILKILFKFKGWFIVAPDEQTPVSRPDSFLAQPLFAAQDLNTPRSFPKIETKAQWKARAENIREQALVSCGLWPLPEKTPLKAHVFGKLVRDGYTIEKVYFQSYPGFFVAGNLYRPTRKGPFPGVLNPHGHWEMGRLTDTEAGSAAARCINFAKQGMVAFTYDMVGYNDTFFPDTISQGADKKNLYKTPPKFRH